MPDYPAVDPKKIFGLDRSTGGPPPPPDYAAVSPPEMPLPAPEGIGAIAPQPTNRPTLNGEIAPTGRPVMSDIPKMTMGHKILGALATGMAAFGSPAQGQATEERVFGAPDRELKEKQSEYDVGQEQEQKAREEGSRESLQTAQAGEAKARGEAATAAQENVTIAGPGGVTYMVPRKDAEKLLGTVLAQKGATEREGMKETAAQLLLSGKPISIDQLSAQAIQDKDAATLKKIQDFKATIAAAGKPEPGNFIPVNDAQGNVVGWANPKSRDWVPVGAIQGGAVGAAAGGGGGTTIPAKPNQNSMAQDQSARGDIEYATLYMNGGKFTGPGDELLMERFFDLAKPSSGFRMSQPQIDMLVGGRSWMDSAEGIAYHAKTGQWFPPTQRQQIVDAMKMENQAKQNVSPTSGGAPAAAPTGKGPAVGTVEGGFRFKGGDPSKKESWEKQ